jgi:hypothetical protein
LSAYNQNGVRTLSRAACNSSFDATTISPSLTAAGGHLSRPPPLLPGELADRQLERGVGHGTKIVYRPPGIYLRPTASQVRLRAEGAGAPLIEKVRFAADSTLEGAGFEPSVPRQKARSRCWHSDGHRWNAPPKVKFATDPPLEGSGFEPSVPSERG